MLKELARRNPGAVKFELLADGPRDLHAGHDVLELLDLRGPPAGYRLLRDQSERSGILNLEVLVSLAHQREDVRDLLPHHSGEVDVVEHPRKVEARRQRCNPSGLADPLRVEDVENLTKAFRVARLDRLYFRNELYRLEGVHIVLGQPVFESLAVLVEQHSVNYIALGAPGRSEPMSLNDLELAVFGRECQGVAVHKAGAHHLVLLIGKGRFPGNIALVWVFRPVVKAVPKIPVQPFIARLGVGSDRPGWSYRRHGQCPGR